MIKKKWKLLMLVIFFLFMIIDFSACVNTIVTPGTEENAPEETHTCTNGLCLDYYLTLEGDASNRPHMVLKISNIQDKEYINLVVSWPLVDDYGNVEESLFDMIDNISVRDNNENLLDFEISQKSIMSNNWYSAYKNQNIYFNTLKVYTGGNNEVVIEYDLASNIEIWNGLGGSIENPQDCEYFWAVYLENILCRPDEHQLIEAAYLNIDIPSGWNFATVYPKYGNTIELGTMDYMYGDNIRWMNYQRGGLILFKNGPFILESENIYGVEVQDVYSKEYPNRCCEANFQYFKYLCDHIGMLPINGVLTFCPRINANNITYIRTYQAAPYAWCHGLMGEYFGAGGDVAIGSGGELPIIPLWDLYTFNTDEKNFCLYIHGEIRYWIFNFIQFDSFDEEWFKGGYCVYYENMTASSKYGYEQVKERRFKPMYEFYKDNLGNLANCSCEGHEFLTYFKPALVAFYINELLKEQSGGEKYLDDATQILFENASMGQALTKYSFIDALNSLTDYDFTNIVNDYIYGNSKVLDLDKYFY